MTELCTPNELATIAETAGIVVLIILVFKQQADVFNRMTDMIQQNKERESERFRMLMEIIANRVK